MKLIKVVSIIGLAATLLFSGSTKLKSSKSGHIVYYVIPACDSASSDTCGPISLAYAKNFSLKYCGSALTGQDTAIAESSFTVRMYMADENNNTDLITPNSADSVYDPFGSGSIDNHDACMSKGLELDAAPYVSIVFTRTDKNPIVFDTDTDSVFTFHVVREK